MLYKSRIYVKRPVRYPQPTTQWIENVSATRSGDRTQKAKDRTKKGTAAAEGIVAATARRGDGPKETDCRGERGKWRDGERRRPDQEKPCHGKRGNCPNGEETRADQRRACPGARDKWRDEQVVWQDRPAEWRCRKPAAIWRIVCSNATL